MTMTSTPSPISSSTTQFNTSYNSATITVQSTAITLFASCIICLLVFLLFNVLLRYATLFRETLILALAPRCSTRHTHTVFKSRRRINKGKCLVMKIVDQFGFWIRDAMSWDEEELLTGIPGTGTRQGGKGGKLLRVNLDGIAFLKFNMICMKVTALATFLALSVILPINYTGSCYSYFQDFNDNSREILDDNWQSLCSSTNMTTYVRTTLANIPPVSNGNDTSQNGNTARLIAISLTTWIISIYSLLLIRREWLAMSILRRKYYLEADHFHAYCENVAWIEQESKMNSVQETLGMRRAIRGSVSLDIHRQLKHIEDRRDVWVPNHDYDEPVPPIELYSILITNIPTNPSKVLDEEDIRGGHATIAWQIEYIEAFLEKCFPKEEGFTSSIAAISILPSPPKIAQAWRKWTRLQKVYNRLGYVRALIDDRINEEDMIKREYDYYITTLDYDKIDYDHETLLMQESIGRQNEAFKNAQTSAYQRERAAVAKCCCPYGKRHKHLLTLHIDELKEIESGLVEDATKGFINLNRAQTSALEAIVYNSDLGTSMKKATRQLRLSKSIDGTHRATFLQCGNETRSYNATNKPKQLESNPVGSLLSKRMFSSVKRGAGKIKEIGEDLGLNTILGVLDSGSSVAVVTFTSRQIATAARYCLLDGQPVDNWEVYHNLPLHPLADSAPWDLITARGICKPVTLTLSETQRRNRTLIVVVLIVITCLCYTYPVNFATSKSVEGLLSVHILDTMGIDKELARGFIQGFILMIVLALMPVYFQALANFGSGAKSIAERDRWALKALWLFTILIAFSGSALYSVAEILTSSDLKHMSSNDILIIMDEISQTLPVQVSVTWINLILLRGFITIPTIYLLQAHVMCYGLIGLHCFKRVFAGGGSGGPMPIRIYTDTATVLLCAVALSTASPLVAPFALVYFVVTTPIWKRQLVFRFNPAYNSGGALWPILLEMIIASLIFMQIALTLMMSLKYAHTAAAIAFVPIIPTYIFWKSCYSQLMPAFERVALFNSSFIDLHYDRVSSTEERQKYLDFLVDCHKAAYIPMCIAEEETLRVMTLTPAKVDRSLNECEKKYSLHAPLISSTNDSMVKGEISQQNKF